MVEHTQHPRQDKHETGSSVCFQLGASESLLPGPAYGPTWLQRNLCRTFSMLSKREDGQVKTSAAPKHSQPATYFLLLLMVEASSRGLLSSERRWSVLLVYLLLCSPTPSPQALPFLANENHRRPASCSFSLYRGSEKTRGKLRDHRLALTRSCSSSPKDGTWQVARTP